MFLQLPGAGQASMWSRSAVHDTVATIIRQADYTRSLRTTLLERFLDWLGRVWARIAASIGSIPHGRRVAAIAAVILLLLVAARVIYAARLRAEPDEGGARARGRRGASGTEIWREAESLAASGRFTDAAHALYRATLALLAARGFVRLHESKTSGDYARELRQRGSPVYSAFRRFGACYDRIIYGAGSCDAAGYTTLRDDARLVVELQAGARAA